MWKVVLRRAFKLLHLSHRLSSSLTELSPFLGKTSNFSVYFGTFCQVTTERSKYQLCETTTNCDSDLDQGAYRPLHEALDPIFCR